MAVLRWPMTGRLQLERRPGGLLCDVVVIERRVEIAVGGRVVAELFASPAHLDELAAGYLSAAGLIESAADITELRVRGLRVDVTLARQLSAPTAADDSVRVSGTELRRLMDRLISGAKVHHRTGGAHCAAVARPDGLVVAREDVGRHNAIDKAVGGYLMSGGDRRGVFLMSTGRINRETALKARRFGCPLMVSRSAPTDAAIDLLRRAGVTVVAFVREQRINIYTHPWRITAD